MVERTTETRPTVERTRDARSLVEDAFRRCLSGATARPVTASQIYAYVQSPFAAWCDHHAPPDARDGPSGFQELLLRRGREHEARYVERTHPGLAPLAAETPEAAFRALLERMAAGERVVYQAQTFYLPEGLAGRVDLLERRDEGSSIFGPYHYVVKEIKLARTLKRHHWLQAAFCNHVLGRIQGYTPPQYFLVDRDHKEVAFEHDADELRAVLEAIARIRDGERPEPVYGKGLWPWTSYNDRAAREGGGVSLVTGVGSATQARLATLGIRSVESLAKADEPSLTTLPGVAGATARRIRLSAQALVEGRPLRVGPLRLREARTEVFLDLEGTGDLDEGIEPMDYLIGALVRRDGVERYVSFVAPGLDGEAQMWRAFLSWFESLDDPVLYHWSAYEATHLRRLAERHGCDTATRERLVASLVDLHKVATQAYVFPTHGTSIKVVAPYLGFSWRHKDVDAMESIALFFEYAEAPDARSDRLQRVLDYNEDDCIAMRVVKDWLVSAGPAVR
jgi:predicted RecB family nuclease